MHGFEKAYAHILVRSSMGRLGSCWDIEVGHGLLL